MKKLFSALSIKSEPNQLLDLVLELIEAEDWSSLRFVSDNNYATKDATVSIKYFDPEAFEEMQISFGYAIGKGITIVLRNYIEHLVVVNHEILEKYHTIEFPVSPESLTMRDYRKKLNSVADNIITVVDNISLNSEKAESNAQ